MEKKQNASLQYKKEWKIRLGVEVIIASHLQFFVSALIIHSHKWGETSSTTSLLLVEASGYY